jgi:transposase IS116/IS110/IS902 family protein
MRFFTRSRRPVRKNPTIMPSMNSSYGGIVASEHSSGESSWRGDITKTGKAHLRRVVVEAAWAYRHRPNVGETLRKRQEVVSEEIREIAWKAQHRLHTRYRKLMARGKEKGKVVTATGNLSSDIFVHFVGIRETAWQGLEPGVCVYCKRAAEMKEWSFEGWQDLVQEALAEWEE